MTDKPRVHWADNVLLAIRKGDRSRAISMGAGRTPRHPRLRVVRTPVVEAGTEVTVHSLRVALPWRARVVRDLGTEVEVLPIEQGRGWSTTPLTLRKTLCRRLDGSEVR